MKAYKDLHESTVFEVFKRLKKTIYATGSRQNPADINSILSDYKKRLSSNLKRIMSKILDEIQQEKNKRIGSDKGCKVAVTHFVQMDKYFIPSKIAKKNWDKIEQ